MQRSTLAQKYVITLISKARSSDLLSLSCEARMLAVGFPLRTGCTCFLLRRGIEIQRYPAVLQYLTKVPG